MFWETNNVSILRPTHSTIHIIVSHIVEIFVSVFLFRRNLYWTFCIIYIIIIPRLYFMYFWVAFSIWGIFESMKHCTIPLLYNFLFVDQLLRNSTMNLFTNLVEWRNFCHDQGPAHYFLGVICFSCFDIAFDRNTSVEVWHIQTSVGDLFVFLCIFMCKIFESLFH